MPEVARPEKTMAIAFEIAAHYLEVVPRAKIFRRAPAGSSRSRKGCLASPPGARARAWGARVGKKGGPSPVFGDPMRSGIVALRQNVDANASGEPAMLSRDEANRFWMRRCRRATARCHRRCSRIRTRWARAATGCVARSPDRRDCIPGARDDIPGARDDVSGGRDDVSGASDRSCPLKWTPPRYIPTHSVHLSIPAPPVRRSGRAGEWTVTPDWRPSP